MKRLLLLFFLIFPCALLANNAQQYEAGKDFALKNQASQPQDAKNIPGYQGANIPEASLSSGNLQEALQRKMREEDNSASFINEAHDQRLRFHIDPSKDPIFTESDRIVGSPLETLKANATEIDEPITEKKRRHTCEEAGEPVRTSCLQTRIIEIQEPATKTHRVTAHLYSHGWGGGLSKNIITGQKLDRSDPNNPGWYAAGINLTNPFDPKLKDRVVSITYVNPQGNIRLSKEGVLSVPTGGRGGWIFINHTVAYIDVVYTNPLKPEDIKETLTNTRQDLESKVDLGLCHYHSIDVLEGTQTRIINDHPIKRDWWKRQLNYECSYPAKNTCEALKVRGCVQVNSQCKQWVDKVCVLYEHTYECAQKRSKAKKTKISGNVPWCLDGDCAEQGYAANQDMMEALSKLMVFKEIQKDMDMKGPTIFRGEEYGCNRNCIDFRDCCKAGKGWGVSLGLAGCSEKEKTLARLREERKCVYVGTYCAEKLPIIGCIRKKSNFCCFGTKLARVIHEQGRPQLGVGFGDAENPQCRGLTVEELSRLDFDKINLSELLSDMYSRFKAPNISKLSQDLSEDWKRRIPKMEKEKNPPLQAIKESQKNATF